MAQSEYVVLVDDDDHDVGRMEKMAAHRAGALHRAFSILLANPAGEVLLQRRALGKYHCGGLWANSCCGHPRPGEDVTAAARRRLAEEMNLSVPLVPAGTFRYRTPVDNGLVENELVHLFHGHYQGAVTPNPDEVMDTRWADPASLHADSPGMAPWFSIYLSRNRRFLDIHSTRTGWVETP